MIKIKTDLQASGCSNKLKKFWEISGVKIALIEKNYDPSKDIIPQGDGRNGRRAYNMVLLFCNMTKKKKNRCWNLPVIKRLPQWRPISVIPAYTIMDLIM